MYLGRTTFHFPLAVEFGTVQLVRNQSDSGEIRWKMDQLNKKFTVGWVKSLVNGHTSINSSSNSFNGSTRWVHLVSGNSTGMAPGGASDLQLKRFLRRWILIVESFNLIYYNFIFGSDSKFLFAEAINSNIWIYQSNK